MDERSRREAKAIKKLPYSLLEYLPPRRWRFLSALIVLVIVLAIFLGQVIFTNVKFARMEAEMEKNKSLWESQGITSYFYSISVLEIPQISPQIVLRVTVNGDSSAVDGPEPDSHKYDRYDSIPDLFNIISEAIEARPDGTSELTIEYDPDLGYPTFIQLGDRRYAIGRDGYFSYSVSNFRATGN